MWFGSLPCVSVHAALGLGQGADCILGQAWLYLGLRAGG